MGCRDNGRDSRMVKCQVARSRCRSVAVVLALSAFALSGCGGSSGGTEGQSSPLDPYRSALDGDPLLVTSDEQSGTSGGAPQTYGEIVAACMAESGFEYWPEDSAGGLNAPVQIVEDEIEDADLNGYGIFDSFENVDRTLEEYQMGPNEAYTSAMDDSMYAAYNEAFYGTIWDELGTGDDFEWDWTRAGSDGLAGHILEDGEFISDSDLIEPITPFDDLIAMMDEIPDQVEYQPEWVQAMTGWSDCMAESGFDFLSWDQAIEWLYSEHTRLFFDGLPPREEYDTLYTMERDIAGADLRCRAQEDLEGTRSAIQYRLEEEFVQQHRDRLEEMRNWIVSG